jgi:hypothetical protein
MASCGIEILAPHSLHELAEIGRDHGYQFINCPILQTDTSILFAKERLPAALPTDSIILDNPGD